MSSLELPRASTIESLRFTAQIGVPNVLSGLFRKRGAVVAVTTRIGVEGAAHTLMSELVSSYGPEPFWVKVAGDDTVVVHHPDDIRLVLEGSPDHFASDPDAKRKGMRAFQPDALTISRGDLWQQRRTFAESVLETGSPVHGLADRFGAAAEQEATALLQGDAFTFNDFHVAFSRLARRVILGDSAAADVEVSDALAELMSRGNKMPDEPAEGYDAFLARLQAYVDAAEPGSLASVAADAPAPPGGAAGQLIHWLFATGDTLATNAFRALAASVAHEDLLSQVRESVMAADLSDPQAVAGLDLLGGCLLEAMRLWPTTPMFGRVSLEETRFSRGQVVPAGTPYLIVNLFNHRNRERIPYADRFSPRVWVDGDAADDWSFNFFSHGPQGCPGAGLAVWLGQAFLAQLLAGPHQLSLAGVDLSPGRPMPHAFDTGRARIRVEDLET